MSARFEFCLSDEDTNRLFAVKNNNADDSLTGNEYARKLLEKALRQMHPSNVVFDEYGNGV